MTNLFDLTRSLNPLLALLIISISIVLGLLWVLLPVYIFMMDGRIKDLLTEVKKINANLKKTTNHEQPTNIEK